MELSSLNVGLIVVIIKTNWRLYMHITWIHLLPFLDDDNISLREIEKI